MFAFVLSACKPANLMDQVGVGLVRGWKLFLGRTVSSRHVDLPVRWFEFQRPAFEVKLCVLLAYFCICDLFLVSFFGVFFFFS